jgi:hypothetical protein
MSYGWQTHGRATAPFTGAGKCTTRTYICLTVEPVDEHEFRARACVALPGFVDAVVSVCAQKHEFLCARSSACAMGLRMCFPCSRNALDTYLSVHFRSTPPSTHALGWKSTCMSGWYWAFSAAEIFLPVPRNTA